MDYKDLDEAEAARRKKDVVEFRTKKRNSSIFTVCASLFEIVVSLAIFFVLLITVSLIVSKVASQEMVGKIFPALLLVILLLSLFCGFKIYKATFRAIIKKKGLEDKLLDSVLYHYKTKEEIKQEMDSGLRV